MCLRTPQEVIFTFSSCATISSCQVCHAILDRSWMPNTSVSTIFACVYGLLLYPDHDDPLDSTLTFQMYDTDGQYQAAIVEHVQKHARYVCEWAAISHLDAAGGIPHLSLFCTLWFLHWGKIYRERHGTCDPPDCLTTCEVFVGLNMMLARRASFCREVS